MRYDGRPPARRYEERFDTGCAISASIAQALEPDTDAVNAVQKENAMSDFACRSRIERPDVRARHRDHV